MKRSFVLMMAFQCSAMSGMSAGGEENMDRPPRWSATHSAESWFPDGCTVVSKLEVVRESEGHVRARLTAATRDDGESATYIAEGQDGESWLFQERIPMEKIRGNLKQAIIHSTNNISCYFDPSRRAWSQHVRWNGDMKRSLSENIRRDAVFSAIPVVEMRKKAVLKLLSDADENDAELRTKLSDLLFQMDHPGREIMIQGMTLTNKMGSELRLFLDEPTSAYEINEGGFIQSIVVKENGHVATRITLRYSSDFDFMLPSMEDVRDVYPFPSTWPEGAKELVPVQAVGIRFAKTNGMWTISRVLGDSPASSAGLMEGDILDEVNNRPALEMTLWSIDEFFAEDDIAISFVRDGVKSHVALEKKEFRLWLSRGEPIPYR